MEKCGTLHLNKLLSSSPKDSLCQVWLTIGPVILDKKYENVKS